MAETLFPADIETMQPGQVRYSFLLNEQGGVMDDVMITRPKSANEQKTIYIIINASGRVTDMAHIHKNLPQLSARLLDDRALLALQGPKAAEVMARICDAPAQLRFMQSDKFVTKDFGELWISRSGYTGEDGFEISVTNETVEKLWTALLAHPEVKPIGLGARDSLRLEAGLCLYGHDLDETTTPVEANLVWAIGKHRRTQGGFIGADAVRDQIQNGVARKLVAIRPEGRALARDGTLITESSGRTIGRVTSGGFGASVNGPVCMGYVETAFSKVTTKINLAVRGSSLPAEIVSLPFVPHRYVKG